MAHAGGEMIGQQLRPDVQDGGWSLLILPVAPHIYHLNRVCCVVRKDQRKDTAKPKVVKGHDKAEEVRRDSYGGQLARGRRPAGRRPGPDALVRVDGAAPERDGDAVTIAEARPRLNARVVFGTPTC